MKIFEKISSESKKSITFVKQNQTSCTEKIQKDVVLHALNVVQAVADVQNVTKDYQPTQPLEAV